MEAETLQYSLDEDQWEQDWASILSLAGQPGTSLEQTHVFALAHILRRPIIIYGVKYVKSFRGEVLGLARFQGTACVRFALLVCFIYIYGKNLILVPILLLQLKPTTICHEQKSWDTFAFLGHLPIHTYLTPQTTLDTCIQNFFRVSTLNRVGERRTARKFRKGTTVLWGNPEFTENYEYCITVPGTFVHDCSCNEIHNV